MTTVPKAEVFRKRPTYNEVLNLIEADADKVTLPERTGVEFWDSFAMGQYRELLQQTAAGDSRVAEHQQMGLAYQLHREELARHNYFALGASAAPGPGGGSSGGTELLVPSGRGALAPLAGCSSCDCSPPGSEGRLSIGWFLVAENFPIMVLESYLWTCDGPGSLRNKQIISQAIEYINAAQLPYLWWGDFQCEASELALLPDLSRAGPWGGYVQGPDSPTCNTGNTHRTLDAVIVVGHVCDQ